MQIRASFVRDMLKEVELDPRGDAVVAQLGADVVARIRADTPVAWVDAADFERLLGAVIAVGGDAYLHALSRRHFIRFRENPLLKSTIDAFVRAFGLSPHLLLRGVPRARSSVVKDGGEVSYERVDERSCRLFLRGFHPLNFDAALVNLAGTWVGALELARAEGSVVIEKRNAAVGSADFLVTW